MSTPDSPGVTSVSPPRAWVAAGLRQVRSGRFVRDLSGAALWQLVGKLVQVVGMGHAARCLGPEAVGVSGTVVVAVMFAAMVLDFGIEIVSVRHVAAGTERVREIARAIFTLKFLVATAASLLWMGAFSVIDMDPTRRWVWHLGGVHLMFTTLSFSWFFQATHRVPWFSFVQAANAILTSVVYLLFFRPGQMIGTDLLVLLAVNALLTLGVWIAIHRHVGARLWDPSSLRLALRLFLEGRPNWSFNLSYYLLASMGLPFCLALLNEREAGYFRGAAMLAGAMQMFLSYFAYMMNPRIIRWRREDPAGFRNRILGAVGSVLAAGLLLTGLVHLLRRLVILVIYDDSFLPSADLLPLLVLGKFLALASGLCVWALFAGNRDWWAVFCCWPSIAAGSTLHFLVLPRSGVLGAGWLNVLMEGLLLAGCLLVFFRQERNP